VIHPANAEKAKKLFNTMPLEYTLKDFAEGVPADKIVNAMPSR